MLICPKQKALRINALLRLRMLLALVLASLVKTRLKSALECNFVIYYYVFLCLSIDVSYSCIVSMFEIFSNGTVVIP